MYAWSLVQEDPLEKGMVTHSSILALEIPQTEEPDELQCMGYQRVKYDLETKQQQQFLFHHENDGKSRFDTLWSDSG